jgi:hypothetical protein
MSAWVVVPCPGRRTEELRTLLTALAHPRTDVVVVTTAPDSIDPHDVIDLAESVLVFAEPGMLFGQWFNTAFDYIAGFEPGQYEVFCIGSSNIVDGPDVVLKLATALREHQLTMVGPDLHGRVGRDAVDVLALDTPRTVFRRVPGTSFMVPGELGLRFDPQFRWYYSDDDLEMQSRQIGPVGLVGGIPLHYPAPHPLADEQRIWAEEDRAKYVAKWQKQPW